MKLQKNPYERDNPYEILRISSEADATEIVAAYRREHQTCEHNDPRAQKIQEAKELLTKPSKNKERMLGDLLLVRESHEHETLAAQYAQEPPTLQFAETPEFRCQFSPLAQLDAAANSPELALPHVHFHALSEFYPAQRQKVSLEFDR